MTSYYAKIKEAARKEERERCAKIAETMAWSHPNVAMLGPEQNCMKVAQAIRSTK